MKQIIFVESSPTDMLMKIALTLRKRGYNPILISLIGKDNIQFTKKAYSKRIFLGFNFVKINFKNIPLITYYSLKNSLNLIKATISILKLKPYVVIGRANPNWLCVIAKFIFKKYPFIYFPYDIRSFVYKDYEEAINSGVPEFEIKSERYCFQNVDGIMHKGHEEELTWLDEKVLGEKIKITCPVINIRPYCLPEFTVPINSNKLSKRDREINFVNVGVISNHDSYINSINAIINQKIHFHIYGKIANLTESRTYKILHDDKYKNIINNKYFHMHPQVEQEKLTKEISQYDYGFWPGWYDTETKNNWTATGNKLSSFLEAGLPFFYFDNHKAIDNLMKKYNLDLKISFDEIKTMKKRLEALNYKELIKNVEKARKDLDIMKNIPKLEKFFEEVREFKYNV